MRCQQSSHFSPHRGRKTISLLVLLWVLTVLTACEAPLVLDGVDAETAKTTLRTDQFLAAASIDQRLVVVGSMGTVLVSADAGKSWQRMELPGKPSLIDVKDCGENSFVALDFRKQIWISNADASEWRSQPIDTMETPLALDCSPNGKIWVVGSFSTILSSQDQGASWQTQSLDEDLMFTTVQFLDNEHAVLTGEFGTVVVTRDAGESWETLEPIPNEFYPLTAWFESLQHGWVAGLNGAILSTHDGGLTWERQETGTRSPIFGLAQTAGSVFAAGDHGTVLSYGQGEWRAVDIEPKTLTYYRGIHPLDDQSLLLVGGAGVVTVINSNATETVETQTEAGQS